MSEELFSNSIPVICVAFSGVRESIQYQAHHDPLRRKNLSHRPEDSQQELFLSSSWTSQVMFLQRELCLWHLLIQYRSTLLVPLLSEVKLLTSRSPIVLQILAETLE
ncbi:hypothetical protein CFP56_007353 [Quercus suber]|uniref:Uncharacterized protein n=1 Tax=Quercus suber TaxID=58331 RepID=A0AAW0L682_QUESU